MTLNHEAIRKAYPNVITIDDGTGAFDADGNQVELDQAKVNKAAAEIEAKANATAYQRQRAPEYPSLSELADALYWASTGDTAKLDEYYAACGAVKAKYPKP